MAMRTRFGTGQRLFVAFALLVSTFALASYLMLSHVRSIHDGLLETKQYEEGVRLSLALSSAVRDQYAHQAHTIILGDDSHLPLYAGAHRHVTSMIEQVRRHASLPDERAWVDDIAAASDKLDHVFRERIVTAVLRRDPIHVQGEHARAQLLVTLIQDRTDRLVDRFETSIEDFRTDVERMQVAAWRWNVFFVVVAPLLAALVGLYVHRSVALPVARLQAGAARIANGELDARIQIDTPDEFGALARQFNAMTRSLEEHQQRLVQHEKLAGIGRLAAGVAHEINNPLAVILGYARLLRRKATGEQANDLRIIEDETLRAKAIVDGLLDLSRPVQVERERIDLRALAEETVARLRESGRLEGVITSVSGEGAAYGNAHWLRQVVLNLVRNAAEAAPGGRVEIEIGAAAGTGSLVVRDSGSGLSRDALERVFEPFFTSKDRGTGLGLAVSKGIVQAHGGSIEVANLPTGGARFEVRLPAPAPEERR
jgi:signal transduction histidine kinase